MTSLIYINGLPDRLKSNAKLFANDTSVFLIVKNKEESGSDRTNDLVTISTWAYIQSRPKKNPHKRYCSLEKNSNVTHPIIYFNNIYVERGNQQKHLGIILDSTV